LIHTTDFLTLSEIEMSGKLESLEEDSYYKTKTIYFFYGRPSYRIHPTVKNTRISSFAPVCFVLKPSIDWKPARVYPFDSGAFLNKRMQDVFHPSFKLEDFELGAERGSASAVVEAFYGSNANYIDCQPAHSHDQKAFGQRRLHRLETYLDLIERFPNDGSDERLHSIEIQFEQAVSLKGNLLAVIVPARFFDETMKRELEAKWDCTVVFYSIKAVFSPSDIMGLVFDKVREVLVKDAQIS